MGTANQYGTICTEQCFDLRDIQGRVSSQAVRDLIILVTSTTLETVLRLRGHALTVMITVQLQAQHTPI